MIGWIVLGVIAFIIISLILYGISVYNNLIVLRNHADEGFSTMDVFMKKRYDLIPNLVEVVKGYAKHEKETLENVIKARNMAMSATSNGEKIAGENQLTGALKTLFALSESYPDLKANKNFSELTSSLQEIEKEISDSRRYYNGTVKAYNTKREVFPSSVIANMYRFEKKNLFVVDDVSERKAIKVDFS
ncbi:MAG: LemA family protein [Clostridia bacterium]